MNIIASYLFINVILYVVYRIVLVSTSWTERDELLQKHSAIISIEVILFLEFIILSLFALPITITKLYKKFISKKEDPNPITPETKEGLNHNPLTTDVLMKACERISENRFVLLGIHPDDWKDMEPNLESKKTDAGYYLINGVLVAFEANRYIPKGHLIKGMDEFKAMITDMQSDGDVLTPEELEIVMGLYGVI